VTAGAQPLSSRLCHGAVNGAAMDDALRTSARFFKERPTTKAALPGWTVVRQQGVGRPGKTPAAGRPTRRRRQQPCWALRTTSAELWNCRTGGKAS
jgi:hypothetical protein